MSDHIKPQQIFFSALHWHALCDAEIAISAQPRSWYQQAQKTASPPKRARDISAVPVSAPQMPPTAKPQSSHAPQPPLTGSLAAIADAKKLADAAQSVPELIVAIHDFSGCALKQTATHTVTHDGNWQSGILVIGEAPGRDEDLQGKPFVGRSGKLLDKMLAAINLHDRDSYAISNVVYWRPPGNRTPTDSEVEICRPFFEKFIALTQPRLIIVLGGRAATALLKTSESISRLRGRMHAYHNPLMAEPCKLIASFHPSYLLRTPQKKRQAWHDLLMIKQWLDHK